MHSIRAQIVFSVLFFQIVVLTGQQSTIWDILNKDDRFKVLTMALTAAELVEGAKEDNLGTVFAPTDAAFAKVPQDVATYLSDPANKNVLAQVLAHHVISGQKLVSSELDKVSLPLQLQTLLGTSLTVTKNGNQVKIDDATVVEADILASNGVIHVIDSVLIPSADGN